MIALTVILFWSHYLQFDVEDPKQHFRELMKNNLSPFKATANMMPTSHHIFQFLSSIHKTDGMANSTQY